MRLLPSRIWFGIASAAAALLIFWVFTPSERDRWVKADGAIACRDEADVASIQRRASLRGVGAILYRRYAIERLVKNEKCMVLLAKERVRLHELSTDGTRAQVTLGRNGQPMWIVVSDLKSQSDAWVSAPWLWPDYSAPPPKRADATPPSSSDDKAIVPNYFDQFYKDVASSKTAAKTPPPSSSDTAVATPPSSSDDKAIVPNYFDQFDKDVASSKTAAKTPPPSSSDTAVATPPSSSSDGTSVQWRRTNPFDKFDEDVKSNQTEAKPDTSIITTEQVLKLLDSAPKERPHEPLPPTKPGHIDAEPPIPQATQTKKSATAGIAREETSLGGESWHRIALPQGVSIRLPPNWRVMDKDGQRLVEDFVQSIQKWTVTGKSALSSTLYSPSGKILAETSFRFYSYPPEDAGTQADVKLLTSTDLKGLDAELRRGNEIAARKMGGKVWGWQPIKKENVGEFLALVSEYKARFAHEAVDRHHVRVRVYDGPLSFSLMLSYQDGSETQLRPIIDRIANSLARARAGEIMQGKGRSAFKRVDSGAVESALHNEVLEWVRFLNSRVPIDGGNGFTIIEALAFGDKATLVGVIDVKRSDLTAGEIAKRKAVGEKRATQYVCDKSRSLLQRGVRFHYLYEDVNGDSLYDFEINWDKCKGRS